MRSTLMSMLAGLVALSVSGPAQDHPTGWVFTSFANNTAVLARASLTGAVTTIWTSTPLAFSPSFTVDADNRNYIVWAPSGLLRITPAGTVLATLPLPAGTSVSHMELDDDGHYVLAAQVPNGPKGLVRVDRITGRLTTLFHSATGPFVAEFVIDIDTGDYLCTGGLPFAPLAFRVARNGSAVMTLATFTPWAGGDVVQDLRTGDLLVHFAGSFPPTNTSGIVIVSKNGGSRGFLGLNPFGFGLGADRMTSASPRLAIGRLAGIQFVDLNTRSVTTLFSGGLYPDALSPDRFRNVVPVQAGVKRWDVYLSFPGEGGRGYLAVLSATGVRPHLVLPDSRRILITPDGATVLSLAGLLAPHFTGHAGALDAGGRARAVIDISRLPGLSGVRIWIQAATLGPGGFASIADPVRLTF